MDKQLGQSEQKFQELVENSLMGISIVHEDRFIYMNAEQHRIFGSESGLTRFKDLMIHENDRQRFEQVCQAIEQKTPLKANVEFCFYPSEEAKQRHELRHVVIRTDLIDYQSETMTLVNMVDVTQSKRMEQLALLRSKMASLGQISVGIAHEIRSPLTGIEFLIEGIRTQLASDSPKEQIYEILDQIEKATTKIETVVKRVLDFAKPSEPQVKPGNINQPIVSAIKLSDAAIRRENITLSTRLEEGLSELYIDVHLMEQVFLNLISNAVTALASDGGSKTIEIQSEQQDNDIVITVADSGTGIPLHLRDKIFDPFFTTQNSGTGIGLSICQRIIIDHGGTLSISDSKYNGAQFNIRLPIEKRQFTR